MPGRRLRALFVIETVLGVVLASIASATPIDTSSFARGVARRSAAEGHSARSVATRHTDIETTTSKDPFESGRIVVKYTASAHRLAGGTRGSSAATGSDGSDTRLATVSDSSDALPAADSDGSDTRLVRVPRGTDFARALAKLRARRDVVWAVPDYLAHATGQSVPNDPGTSGVEGGWQQLQWNFSGPFGIEAPEAWSNLAADGRPGGSKVVVAVLDTGVAYANRGRYRRSPDFSRYSFVQGYDFIARRPYANDHNGHGTFVAGTIAEATDNRYGLTGLAYEARIMPVRVLDSAGEGDASVIAEGVRFAVKHGAKIINLSLEFSSDVKAQDIPELIEALRYANRRGVLVVAAAGNEGSTTIPYPARAKHVIVVGATTEHGCLASYSNDGRGVTLVAPGGGPDASLPGDPNCDPAIPSGRDIFQMTFTGSSPRAFGFPDGYEGTSMATPHVSATAALIIASGVLGHKPTPVQITARLKATARALGDPQDRDLYGAGLLDAAAATAPGGPGAQ